MDEWPDTSDWTIAESGMSCRNAEATEHGGMLPAPSAGRPSALTLTSGSTTSIAAAAHAAEPFQPETSGSCAIATRAPSRNSEVHPRYEPARGRRRTRNGP